MKKLFWIAVLCATVGSAGASVDAIIKNAKTAATKQDWKDAGESSAPDRARELQEQKDIIVHNEALGRDMNDGIGQREYAARQEIMQAAQVSRKDAEDRQRARDTGDLSKLSNEQLHKMGKKRVMRESLVDNGRQFWSVIEFSDGTSVDSRKSFEALRVEDIVPKVPK